MSALIITDGFNTPRSYDASLSVRCDAYSTGTQPCSRDVVVGGLGLASVNHPRFISDHDKSKGLALYAFCQQGHTIAVGHIDTIPVLGLSPSSFTQMQEGAIDLSGLSDFISGLSR